MAVTGWIVGRESDRAGLEALGVKVGRYNKTNSEFQDCLVDDAAMDKLDPLWGRFIWFLVPVENA